MGNITKFAAEQHERVARYTSARNAAILLDGLKFIKTIDIADTAL